MADRLASKSDFTSIPAPQIAPNGDGDIEFQALDGGLVNSTTRKVAKTGVSAATRSACTGDPADVSQEAAT